MSAAVAIWLWGALSGLGIGLLVGMAASGAERTVNPTGDHWGSSDNPAEPVNRTPPIVQTRPKPSD